MVSKTCFMCKLMISENVKTVEDVKTEYSQIPLGSFIKIILKCNCNNEHSVCSICLSELNQLDFYHFKYEELKQGLVDKLKRIEPVEIKQIVPETNLDSESILLKCKECDAELSSEDELKKHTLKEHSKLQFTCHIINGPNVDEIPGKQIAFTCTICEKTFTQKIALKRHMPLHTGDRPHECKNCGKRFAHHSSLNAHKLSHVGIKKYKCLACGESFINSSHLKRHLKIHTGLKEFACDICNKKFSENYNLSAHRKIHNKENNTVH